MSKSDQNGMELLKEEMTSDQLSVRINAIHRIPIIATQLNKDEISKLLQPYLESLLDKEDDEVLYALAKQLGKLYPTYTDNHKSLINILEVQAGMDETVIRDAAVESLYAISKELNNDQIANDLVPVVLRLAGGIMFQSRVSAVHIMAQIYDKFGPHRDTLRRKFIELCGEETPMIRRAVAMRIGDLSSKMDWDLYLSEMIPVFKTQTNDDQDSVRILCIDSLIVISKTFTKDLNKNHMIPILIQLTRDKAWRVRSTLGKKFQEIALALKPEIIDSSLVNIFPILCQDAEGDVRCIAINSQASWSHLIKVEKRTILLPIVLNLLSDTQPLVRAGAAEVVSKMVESLPKDLLLSKVMPALHEAHKEEVDIEVKIEIQKAFRSTACNIGVDFFSWMNRLDFKKNFDDPNWRVRIEVFDMVVNIALELKSFEMFEAHLQSFFYLYIDDKAMGVRLHGCKSIKKLEKLFTNSWLEKEFLPKLEIISNIDKGTYLYKLSTLKSIEQVGQITSGALLTRCVNNLIAATKNKVPNIRFTAVKLLHKLLTRMSSDDQNNATSSIKALLDDKNQDVDVKYFSQQFLQKQGN